jgi:hypothetical protein
MTDLTPATPAPKVLPDHKLAYSMRECAVALGISYISVQRLLKRGLLKSSNALRTKIIPRTEIEKFLARTLE